MVRLGGSVEEEKEEGEWNMGRVLLLLRLLAVGEGGSVSLPDLL